MLSNPALVSLASLLRDFARYSGWKGLKAFVFVFLGALVEGVGIVLLIPFFSVIIGSNDPGGRVQHVTEEIFSALDAESRITRLGLLVLCFAILLIARAIILTIRDVTARELEVGFVQQIRLRITHLLAAASWDTVSRLRHSRITHLMGADIYQVGSAMHILQGDSVALVMLGSQIIIAFMLSPPLATIALCMVLAGILAITPMLRLARTYGQFVVDANLSLIDDVNQFLGALKLAISQNLQTTFMREFDESLAELSRQEIAYVRKHTTRRLAAVTIAGLVGAATLFFGVAFIQISPSVLITFLLLMSRMNGPVMQLQGDAQQFAHVLPAYEKIKDLQAELASSVPVEEPWQAAGLLPIDGPIVFRQVSFSHQDERGGQATTRGGVRDLNIAIQPGSIVGIVGPSGAGKTTFADLLVGLYQPQSGDIRIGDTALAGAALASWRSEISYAVQDPFLFHDTIRRNLLWAKPEAQEAEIWEALRIADAADVVRRLPRELETLVGERGALLSGGERQRLCLARAILRKPHLLVMDEATSAIDVETELRIFDRLLELSPRPTIIVIAHRPESLKVCQRLLIFEQGEFVSEKPMETVPTQTLVTNAGVTGG